MASCAAALGLPAIAAGAGTVYVTNVLGGVTQYSILANGALAPLKPFAVAAGSDPFGIAVSPDGSSAYVANNGGPSVSQYDIDPTTGELSPKAPPTVPAGGTGSSPSSIAVAPDGKHAYVPNSTGGDVLQYGIDPIGDTLSLAAASAVPTTANLEYIAIAPDGRSAYVTDGYEGGVSQFDIDPGTGDLSPKTPASVGTDGEFPSAITVAPNGRSAYITDYFANAVSQYAIDPVTGELTPLTPATVPAGDEPFGVTVAPDGRSAYVANLGASTVSQYTIDPASGALTAMSPASVASGSAPDAVAVSSDGRGVYVANSLGDDLSQYSVDGITGALSPQTPATVAAASEPLAIAVGRRPLAPGPDPTSTVVNCSPSRLAPGDPTRCTATVADTAGSGRSTPHGTVSFATSGVGSFSGAPCTLSGTGAAAGCTVSFTSLAVGPQTISGTYGGDSSHRPSDGTSPISVALPASTRGCVITGHGRLTAAAGDPARFGGLALATPLFGAEHYRDRGPARPFRLVSRDVQALTCAPDAAAASIYGQGETAGASVTYRIDVELSGAGPDPDAYRIRLSNGYDSGTQPVRSTTLQIHISG